MRIRRVSWSIMAVVMLFGVWTKVRAEGTVEAPESAAPEVGLVVSRAQLAATDEAVVYSIVNNTDETIMVVMAPALERLNGDSWEHVQLKVVFCGVGDPVRPGGYNGRFPLAWCQERLQPGTYRLTLCEEGETVRSVTDDGAEAYLYSTENARTFSAEFEIVE